MEVMCIKTNTCKTKNHKHTESSRPQNLHGGGRFHYILRVATEFTIQTDMLLKVKGGDIDHRAGITQVPRVVWEQQGCVVTLSPHHSASGSLWVPAHLLSIVCHCAPYKVMLDSVTRTPVFFLESACLCA